jgi:hypothetical protein
VTGGWRRFHNEDVHNIMESEMNRPCSMYGKLFASRLFGRPSNRWEVNNKISFCEVGWDGMVWIYLAYSGMWSVVTP